MNSLQTLVNQDKTNISTDKNNVAIDTPQPTNQCMADVASGQPCPTQPTSPTLRRDEAQLRKNEASLKADEFKLQVAQDQLKKDESSN